MFKKSLLILLVVLLAGTLFVGCGSDSDGNSNDNSGKTDLAGEFIGYSWRGEAGGTEFADANQYIETTLKLDDDGTILAAEMLFYVEKDGKWVTRQQGEADVGVDFSVDPTLAVPGEDYKPGDSMFTVSTVDMMSFYAIAVDSDGTIAVAIVDPVIRYQHEMKFSADFDFDKPFGDLTIGSGLAIPTTRVSGSGLVKPGNWEDLADNTIFDIAFWSHVLTDAGVLEGIDNDSTVKEFVEAIGVEFVDGKPKEMPLQYGRHSLGGWEGNLTAIAEYLIGKSAKEVTSLVDWSNSRYSANINDQNHFGVDTESGATRTVQNSIDGIAGATVRISRESTSYQRALVEAGIISEDDVIIGRF